MQSQGQQLFAKIKKSSKYYATQSDGTAFPVFIKAGHPEAYVVQGGEYRLADVNLYVVQDGREMRIS